MDLENSKLSFEEDREKRKPERKARSPSAEKLQGESAGTAARRRKFQTDRYERIYGKKTGSVRREAEGATEAISDVAEEAINPIDPVKKVPDRIQGARFRRNAAAAGIGAAGTAWTKTKDTVMRYADDNSGSEAFRKAGDITEEAGRTAAGMTGSVRRRIRHKRLEAGKSIAGTVENAAGQTGSYAGKFFGRQRTEEKAYGSVNPLSKRWQKRALQQEYAAARTGRMAETARTAGWHTTAFRRNVARSRKRPGRIIAAIRTNPKTLLITVVAVILLIVIVSASVTAASTVLQGTTNAVMASSYTATDHDIKKAEHMYRDLEEDLKDQIDRVKSDYPGYENYEFDVAGIGHNPYELAALLTVLHEDYKAKDVEEDLKKILALQYDLKINGASPEEGSKTVRVGQSLGTVTTSGYCNCAICCGKWAGGRTASGTVPKGNHTLAVDAKNPVVPLGTKVIMNGIEYTVEDTGAFARYGVDFDVYYDSHAEASAHGHKKWEAYIADDNGTTEVTVRTGISGDTVTVSLDNRGIDYAAEHIGLTEDGLARYELLKELKGNRPELFENDIYANAGTGSGGYTISPEALTDERFANMIREAEKYLGYPYVWGGSSPSTSFDCSGFVSYVINHCGNGWDYGRLTANGLYNTTARVSKDEAKPGDLIFFQGTYNTSGASHVGIYVGNGRMIHCGNPIQYTSIETNYWQRHFLGFGRLP